MARLTDQVQADPVDDGFWQVVNSVGEIISDVKGVLESWRSDPEPHVYVPQTVPAQQTSGEPAWDKTSILLAGGVVCLVVLVLTRRK